MSEPQDVRWAVEYDGEADKGVIVGGTLTGEVLASQEVQFQHGPIQENGVNGIQNEEMLELLTSRLRYLNSKFPCRENSIAITHLEEAAMWLRKRTATRRAQGVEGKNEAHVS